MDAQCTVQPLATLEQPINLSGGLANVTSVVYVRAAGYTDGSPFRPFFERAQQNGWQTFVAPCGHYLMLDLPDYVVRILVQAAEAGAAASITRATAHA